MNCLCSFFILVLFSVFNLAIANNEINSKVRVITQKLNNDYSIQIKTDREYHTENEGIELTIFKASKQVYFKAVEKGSSGIVGIFSLDDFLVKDITLSGTASVVIQHFTGGAHCCFNYEVLSLGKKNIRKIAQVDSSDYPIEIKDFDGNGTYELILQDMTFSYWHAPFVSSPAGQIILEYQDGLYKPSTKLMKKKYTLKDKLLEESFEDIYKDLQELKTFNIVDWIENNNKHGDDIYKSPYEYKLPSRLWGVMLELLYTGNGELALEFLDRAWHKKIEGKEVFLKEFKKRLLTSPYISVVKEMNPSFFK